MTLCGCFTISHHDGLFLVSRSARSAPSGGGIPTFSSDVVLGIWNSSNLNSNLILLQLTSSFVDKANFKCAAGRKFYLNATRITVKEALLYCFKCWGLPVFYVTAKLEQTIIFFATAFRIFFFFYQILQYVGIQHKRDIQINDKIQFVLSHLKEML